MAGLDEAGKERMRCEWLRLEFRMELDGHVPRVRGQFDDLDKLAVERASHDLQSLVGQRFFKEAVELVPVAMPLVNDWLTIKLMRARSRLEFAGVRPQPHRASEVVNAEKIAQFVDHVLRRVGCALG